MTLRSLIALAVLGSLGACASPDRHDVPMPDPVLVGPYFLSDGSPLAVLSRADLAAWGGGTGEDMTGGDYQRACEAGDIVGAIAADCGSCVVLGAEEYVSAAQWIRHGDRWLVLAWMLGEEGSEAKVLARLRDGEVTEWTPLAESESVEGGLVLFGPASPGTDFDGIEPRAVVDGIANYSPFGGRGAPQEALLTDAIVAPVAAGEYSIDWAFVTEPDEFEFALVRWIPVER